MLISIRDYIIDNFMGEAPLYTSFILETKHSIVKYLIYTASTDFTRKPISSYNMMWSAFVAIMNHNRSNFGRSPSSNIESF